MTLRARSTAWPPTPAACALPGPLAASGPGPLWPARRPTCSSRAHRPRSWQRWSQRRSGPSQSSMMSVSRRPAFTGRTQCGLCETKTSASPRPKWCCAKLPSLSAVQNSPPSKSTPGALSITSMVMTEPPSKCVGSGNAPPGPTRWCSTTRGFSLETSAPARRPQPLSLESTAMAASASLASKCGNLSRKVPSAWRYLVRH
mmetsp:Transcript_74133/g.206049  ORF Transcript_74133/g.206049 Transcript_74133/m.206049 type:complete len:201 (-) Transcript_74133:1084-1686(-)